MKYLLFIILGAILAAACYLGLLGWSAGTPANATAASVKGWYDKKDEIAQNLPSPRILIGGGSANLYGIVATRIEAATGIPTVNFGTHAALSLDYHLYRLRKIARRGDIIILGLEYEFYTDSKLNAAMSDYVFGGDPGFLLTLSPAELANWLASASGDVVWRPFADLLPTVRHDLDALYASSRDQLDERGDFFENNPNDQLPGQKAAVENAPPIATLKGPRHVQSEEVWQKLSDFVEVCHEDGITVVATFPATISRPIYKQKPYVRAMRVLVDRWNDLGIPLLGTPADFLRPADDFFDTVYHLNSRAAGERTMQLIEQLQPLLPEDLTGNSQP